MFLINSPQNTQKHLHDSYKKHCYGSVWGKALLEIDLFDHLETPLISLTRQWDLKTPAKERYRSFSTNVHTSIEKRKTLA